MNLVLTSEQEAIVQTLPNRDIAINASPGSAKTTTMLYRIHYLWKAYQIPLNQIALFTFNNFLAQDMTSKLAKFGIPANSLVWCGTLHAFCYRETKSMDNLSLWSQKFSHGYPIHDDYAPREIKRFREHCSNLRYIIFDEYQDADADIAEVLRILSMNRYLTIVGDERQQIYGFRDADSSYLMELKPSFTKFNLSLSFRCNDNICRFLSRLYPNYGAIRSNRSGLSPILYRSKGKAMNNPDIIDTVIQIVTNALNKNYTVAILAPTIRSEKSELFLNDVYSNINQRFQLGPEQRFSLLGEDSVMANNVVSTIHGVKGREYDVVVLLNAVDSPSLFDPMGEDDRCKFFVACSRARHELHLFEHLFGASGSLTWITDNEDLLIPGDTMYGINKHRIEPRVRKESTHKNWVRACSDYIRGINVKERAAFLNQYTDPELINKDPINLGEFFPDTEVGPNAQSKLLERLIELAINIKLIRKFRPTPFPMYITKWEWRQLMSRRYEFPATVNQKVSAILESSTYSFKYEKGRFAVGFKDAENQLHANPNHFIDENCIISDIMCREYYQHLTRAQEAVRQLKSRTFQSITPETLNLLLILTKFESLVRLNVNQFNTPDPNPEILQRLVYILNSRMALEQYHPFLYNLTVEAVPPKPPVSPETSSDLEEASAFEINRIIENRSILAEGTPQIEPITPRLEPITPRVEPITPRLEPITPRVEPITPRVQPITPRAKRKDPESILVRAQFDLLSTRGLIAVRCGTHERRIEDIWLELIFNNHIFATSHYKTWCESPYETMRDPVDRPLAPGSVLRPNLYYYNPMTGELWLRQFMEFE